MAVFNPQIPDTQDPNWLNYSKSITQPSGDKSTGIALATVAEGIEGGLKLADTATKSVIEDQIYNAAKAEQQQYMDALSEADKQLRVAQAGGPGGQLNILEGTQAPGTGAKGIPDALKHLPIAIDGLGNARANGKLSQTGYAQRIDLLAKDFRARYPGYRPFIDQTFERVTGIDAANKYISSVLGDINSFAQAANAKRNHVVTWATNHEVLGFPGMQGMLNKYMAGQATEQEVYNAAAPFLQQKYQFQQNKSIVEDMEGQEKIQKNMAGKAISADAAAYVGNSLDNLLINTGGGPKKMQDWLRIHQPGTEAYKSIQDTHWISVAQMVRQNKTDVEKALWDEYNTAEPGKRSMVQILGETEVRNRIAAQLKWHDQVLADITDKDTGRMFNSVNMAKAESAGILRQLMKDYPVITAMKVFNDAGGPEFASRMYTSGLLAGMKRIDQQGMNAIINMIAGQPQKTNQPGVVIPPQLIDPATGRPRTYTLNDAFDATQPPPSGSPTVTPGSPELRKEITKIPAKIILDPKATDTVKINTADASFSPGNANFIGKIEGIGNKYQVFTDNASPAMSREMKKLGEKAPEVWTNYKRWVGNEYFNHLHKTDVQSLNDMEANPNIRITWDDKNFRFEVDTSGVQRASRNFFDYGGPQVLANVERIKNRINLGLSSIAEVYKLENKNPNEYIIQSFLNLGYEPRDGSFAKAFKDAVWTNAAGQMEPSAPAEKKSESAPAKRPASPTAEANKGRGLSIFPGNPVLTRPAGSMPSGTPFRPDLTDRALPFSEENAPSSGVIGDLRSWISNPAGTLPARKNNAPAASTTRKRGNLTDEELISVTSEEVPLGVDINEVLRRK